MTNNFLCYSPLKEYVRDLIYRYKYRLLCNTLTRGQQFNCWDGRPFGHNRHGSKSGEGLLWGALGHHLTQCMAWAEAYLFIKWHLDPSNRLATIVGMPRSSAYEYPNYGLFLSAA